jgi:hypothetical protein
MQMAEMNFIARRCDQGCNRLRARNIQNSISLTRTPSRRIICIHQAGGREPPIIIK